MSSTKHSGNAPRGDRRVTRDDASRRGRRRLRGHRGVAYTEAVVALPFFIIVWGLIIYLHNLYGRAMEYRAWARTCTWNYAFDGCATVPPGCAQFLGRPAASVRMTEDMPSTEADAVVALTRLPSFGTIARPVNDANNSTTGQGTRDVPRSALLGGNADRIRASQGVLCNEINRPTPASIGRPAFCNLVPMLCR